MDIGSPGSGQCRSPFEGRSGLVVGGYLRKARLSRVCAGFYGVAVGSQPLPPFSPPIGQFAMCGYLPVKTGAQKTGIPWVVRLNFPSFCAGVLVRACSSFSSMQGEGHDFTDCLCPTPSQRSDLRVWETSPFPLADMLSTSSCITPGCRAVCERLPSQRIPFGGLGRRRQTRSDSCTCAQEIPSVMQVT